MSGRLGPGDGTAWVEHVEKGDRVLRTSLEYNHRGKQVARHFEWIVQAVHDDGTADLVSPEHLTTLHRVEPVDFNAPDLEFHSRGRYEPANAEIEQRMATDIEQRMAKGQP